MAGQAVLKHTLAFSVALAIACGSAAAEEPEDRPLFPFERITVGVADDLLGQLSPDGARLYFVSNRNTASQLFVQDLADGRARLLFDDDADVTWPRISPDGRSLLYVSYRDQAGGRLCVRDLPDGGNRRCLEDGAVGLQGEWIDDHRIALVSRPTVAGELRVMDVALGPRLTARPLLERSVSSPAVSPDGQWLVYVPVSRTTPIVGPAFAAHAGQELEVVSLARPAPPSRVTVDLPGQTAQPVFARDGRSLYVVQFFVDTNHDGAVDAGDHGVLFRVPIELGEGAPKLGAPVQLTETSSNCEYPAPTRDRLILTCSDDGGGSLDVYSLPLDGQVPAGWATERLAVEEADAETLSERQMLASHVLARATEPLARRRALLALALVHLEADEYRAAEYFSKKLEAAGDPKSAGLSMPLVALVEQRRASRRREQGRMLEGFAAAARKRLDLLRPDAAPSNAAAVLTHLVRSEVADSIGDKGMARAELEAVGERLPEAVVRAYYLRADALYRELDDRAALVNACERLSADDRLPADERLGYAHAAVRARVRGLSRDEASQALAAARVGASLGSELAFVLEEEAVVSRIEPSMPNRELDRVLAFYDKEPRRGRRQELMKDVVTRAEAVRARDPLVTIVAHDLASTPKEARDRGRAERRFRRALLARAYERQAASALGGAREDFEAVVRETGYLEAVVGAVDVAIKQNEAPATIASRFRAPPLAPPVTTFAKAYLLARGLPKLVGAAHEAAVVEGLAALRAEWGKLRNERIAQSLLGTFLHEKFLMTGDLASAERANNHYLVALELMGKSPRFRALILGQLGALQADVGNFHIALGYLEERDKYPYVATSEGLDSLLSLAQSELHTGNAELAADTALRAQELAKQNPGLSRYELLVLDAAALYSLVAGRFERAHALYDEEVPLLASDASPVGERNRLVVRLARAAAAVGLGRSAEALPDLDYVESRLTDVRLRPSLKWPHASIEHVVSTYRAMSDGLRAVAQRALGHYPEEARALAERLELLEGELGETHRVETSRASLLTLVELAVNASARHDVEHLTSWSARALARADAVAAEAGPLDRDVLDTLWVTASLVASNDGASLPELASRLASAATEISSKGDPRLRSYARWFEAFAPIVRVRSDGSAQR